MKKFKKMRKENRVIMSVLFVLFCIYAATLLLPLIWMFINSFKPNNNEFFYDQWKALKKYANDNGISIIGDLPIYVAGDSADVWASPDQFVLDENCKPTEVAGCPPDAFTADGQLWGNPLYNWDKMREDGYAWWCRFGN